MQHDENLEVQVKRLRLQAGDILVATFDHEPSAEEASRLRDILGRTLAAAGAPATPALITGPSCELSVLRTGEGSTDAA